MVELNFQTPSEKDRKAAIGALAGSNFRLRKSLENVEKYWIPKVLPGPSDWLAEQFECGQTFSEFETGKNAKLTQDKDRIALIPLDKTLDRKFLTDLKKFCTAFFQCKVYSTKAVEAESVGLKLNEFDQLDGSKIIQYININVKPKERKAVCYVGITNKDLTLEEFGFVFGVANVMTESGVFSFARYTPEFNGDIVNGEDDKYNLMLYRACKVMSHEASHMFGLRHCIYYECCMNGSNHMQESETRPINMCPICLRKIASATGFDVVKHY